MVSITCFTPKVAYMRNIFPLMVCSKEKLTIAYVKKKKKKQDITSTAAVVVVETII